VKKRVARVKEKGEKERQRYLREMAENWKSNANNHPEKG
jgi:hypothetical protein